jgi:nucleoside phosphorylase
MKDKAEAVEGEKWALDRMCFAFKVEYNGVRAFMDLAYHITSPHNR